MTVFVSAIGQCLEGAIHLEQELPFTQGERLSFDICFFQLMPSTWNSDGILPHTPPYLGAKTILSIKQGIFLRCTIQLASPKRHSIRGKAEKSQSLESKTTSSVYCQHPPHHSQRTKCASPTQTQPRRTLTPPQRVIMPQVAAMIPPRRDANYRFPTSLTPPHPRTRFPSSKPSTL